jgi:ERCC4-type nuclease
MKAPNRDMLVLVKDEFLDSDLIKVELERIHQLLISFETFENVCKAHEVFDLNRYKKIKKADGVRKVMMERQTKAFVFISNNN